MRTRIVLYADEGTVLTNGKDYGTVVWLAEGESPDSYHPIPRAEFDAMMAEMESGSADL